MDVRARTGAFLEKAGSFSKLPAFSFWLNLFSPDLAHIASDHFVVLFAAEGFGKFGNVGNRSVDAVARVRMRVGQNLLALEFGRRFRCPDLRPAEEESLFGRETVDVCGARFAHQ